MDHACSNGNSINDAINRVTADAVKAAEHARPCTDDRGLPSCKDWKNMEIHVKEEDQQESLTCDESDTTTEIYASPLETRVNTPVNPPAQPSKQSRSLLNRKRPREEGNDRDASEEGNDRNASEDQKLSADFDCISRCAAFIINCTAHSLEHLKDMQTAIIRKHAKLCYEIDQRDEKIEELTDDLEIKKGLLNVKSSVIDNLQEQLQLQSNQVAIKNKALIDYQQLLKEKEIQLQEHRTAFRDVKGTFDKFYKSIESNKLL